MLIELKQKHVLQPQITKQSPKNLPHQWEEKSSNAKSLYGSFLVLFGLMAMIVMSCNLYYVGANAETDYLEEGYDDYLESEDFFLQEDLFSSPAVSGGFSAEDSPQSPQGLQSQNSKDKYIINDYFEQANRYSFAFNNKIDKYFFAPIARGYKSATPKFARNRITDFFGNLSEPVTFVNSLLQGNLHNAANSFWRFVVNTSLGGGGFVDIASEAGLFSHKEDFGQTLAVYGVGSGSYIMMPFFGPSTIRDFLANLADMPLEVSMYFHEDISLGLEALERVHDRADLLAVTDDVFESSLDPYQTVKSAYIQNRISKIMNQDKKR